MGKKVAKKEEPPPAEGDDEGGGGGSTSNHVYIMHKEYAWVPARLISSTADKAEVEVAQYDDEFKMESAGKNCNGWKKETVDLKLYANKSLPLQNVKGEDLIEKPDMVDLPYLHEAGILFNVKARHAQALPYTRTGDIVIAVNPYQWLTHLYTEKEQIFYAMKLVWEENENDPRKEVEPHVYETSALSYRGLAANKVNQSILVSGESGAGKTETVKICMNHMASVQRGPVKEGGGEYQSVVVQRVLDSNPLLEAFGNAKTRRNDNSSRFGKYINLQFKRRDRTPGENFERCEIAGSKCDVYLLEKSRIVQHEDIEGTYHIFYFILAATDTAKKVVWDGLLGKDYDSFKYVGSPPYERKIEGNSDAVNYDETVKSLALIHVKGDKLVTLMRGIMITLTLGNVNFAADPKDEERSIVSTKPELAIAQSILGVDLETLGLAFTERTMKTRSDTFKVPMKFDVAKESCDAFAKEIYSRAFLWLVREINGATCAEENFEGGGQRNFGMIGLLDIFGFESFPINGFEQLCINYANEKLQQKFTKDIFEAVQIEYEAEGINLDDISYDDNSDVLALIEGKTGLIKMLNEECVRPKGNEQTFVSKLVSGFKGQDCLIHQRTFKPVEFGVHHYAGKVIYMAGDWIGRNNDTLPLDLVEIAKQSENEIVRDHLQNDATMKVDYSEPGEDEKKKSKSNDTIWTKFKNQLGNLMSDLHKTQSRYIRCLKPNTIKKPVLLQHMTTIEQLRCAGVVAAVTISRSAFPNRLLHEEFLNRFKVMKSKGTVTSGKPADDVVAMLTPVLKKFETEDGKQGFAMGLTRVYFKGGVLEYLEQERNKHWSKWVVEVQRYIRGWLVKRKLEIFRLMAKEPMSIQIQSWWRIYDAKKIIKNRKNRAKIAKKMAKRRKKAIVKLQAVMRGCIQRPKYKAELYKKHEKDLLVKQMKEKEEMLKEAEKQKAIEIEEAKAAAQQEIEAYKTMLKETMNAKKEAANQEHHQRTLIEESGKIIEYLRKEHMKLKAQNETLRKDFKSLKENNARLMEANASASKSFVELNEHAKGLNGTNAKLIKEVEGYKQDMLKIKEDLKLRQAYYLAEAEARLKYQKTMAQIVTGIQDKCRDAQLIEDVVIMALECEAAAKAERASLDSAAAAKRAQSAPPPPPKPAPKPAPAAAAKEESDDDDSDSS